MRSSSVHDEWVETIESEDGKEISRLDQTLVNFNYLGGSFFKFPSHGVSEPLNVSINHILGDVRSFNWSSIGIGGKSTNEAEESFEE